MDTIKGLKRTNYCGDLRIEDVGKEVTLFGWCQPTEKFLQKHRA